ncbi:adenylosuccinate lyase [Grosmannia clavigera kw1407]|uniref:Adenylosuccinate lyase n=1 Tax=Grosmannia clavigera (strain kw1407 / UAMH 11150) TaxID=655863 RepID=F0XS13_GROCL|nr:adenylosuccinate lyase [Grosmannia clavigera kw1407]EFW99516.1 adenylosuccinate lyase [Grosmannia clavigera kw1407]
MGASKERAGPSPFDTYQTSLTSRYCSEAMARLYGQRSRHSLWRKLWLLLAESESELGIDTITPEALQQMAVHLEVTDEDFKTAQIEEKKRRHDVMAHVHAFGTVAPAAAGIIHYGATSCYVTDNAELILMRDAMDLLLPKLSKVISNLAKFAMEWKDMPTLAYTHLQPAQLITVGKRASQWAQDLVLDLQSIEHVRNGLLLRGAQGTTGTQASFLEIFNGDGDKCDQLNELICKKTGFSGCYDVSTQTYTRKIDSLVANAICGLGSTAQKIAGDIRHLASWKEAEEPFEASQIGSSAMVCIPSHTFLLQDRQANSEKAYKRNPMRSERVSSLARELLSKQATTANTLAAQWMERSLDDSAVRRIDIPEMFLLADAILGGLDNITNGIVIYPKRIALRVQEELPFMITESIIVKLCALGASRQEAHEQIRVLSQEAGYAVKGEGKPNDLVQRIKANDFFKPIWGSIDDMLRPELYIGRSVTIVERYCGPGGVVEKTIQPYKAIFEKAATTELSV